MDVGIQAEAAQVGIVGSSLVNLLLVSDTKPVRTGRDTSAWIPTEIVRVNGARAPNLITNFSLNAATPRLVRGVVVRRAA